MSFGGLQLWHQGQVVKGHCEVMCVYKLCWISKVRCSQQEHVCEHIKRKHTQIFTLFLVLSIKISEVVT